jgi:pilus assembly protein Flp/PilA
MLHMITNASAMVRAANGCLRRLKHDSSGVTAIEYGLIAGAIAVAIITTVVALGGDINNMFAAVGSALNSAGGTN